MAGFKKKKKVLLLIDAWFPFMGGAQIQIKNLKQVLEKNYNIEYFILHSPSSNILVRFFWPFWVIPQALFLHLREKFDLIHAHAYWPGIPGKILSFLLGLPVVFTVHGSNLMDLGSKSVLYLLEKFILTKIKYNWVITVSYSFKKYFNVNKNIKVIPNGVNVKKFAKVKVKKAVPFKVLFVGRNDPVKGLKYLKQAMVLVKKQVPKARLVVIQNGKTEVSLIKEYKKSHLFCLPSLSEGQPLTLLEAWAAKLPVVVTDVGDNSRFVMSGVNGWLVKPGDAKDLAVKIVKVLKDKNRSRMGEAGFKLVKDNYSWKETARKTYEVYKKIIKNS
jgi:glycosyltransferase involved in cell wall biosynthesis